ncbi:MAG: hypothetical protein JRE18_07820 [Deltaproteobacteria bacterium]|jgi:radical SAM superfamily enzyme YgiQ (UPF0313 family)|nr:hypothetical protein [Deltaproteobacteria bacterium]
MNRKKKIGIITLTRQTSLAYTALKRTVEDLGYEPICGEAIGSDCIFFPLEEINLVGYDFLADFFKKAKLSEADAILISAPYTVNWFMLPKVVHCLRTVSAAPIILGGNEASNNYKNLMRFRFSTFVNEVVDVAPDFIVRGAAENVLPDLLPLLDGRTLAGTWDRYFLKQLLEIPNIVFWLPQRKALIATEFSAEELSEKDIFSYVKYGEKSIAVTLQRACIWAKKSRGGCLFCAIASQFGDHFHCAVQSDFFVEDLSRFLNQNPRVKYVDIWDDTFNINPEWAMKICGYLKNLSEKAGRKIRYSCFLRPKGLTEKLVTQMAEANIRTAFIGADAMTDELSRRMRRGCTVSEMNAAIALLAKGKIQPRLSVQLFSPESTIDDVGITSTLALGCIKNGESSVHVHLYTYPLYGSDIHKLLGARDNLKTIPAPLLKLDKKNGFEPYSIAFDYMNYDPDVEAIKQKTFKLLNIETSFYVRTYPGDTVDAASLKKILNQIRSWSLDAKKSQAIKSLWYMMILFWENQSAGLSKTELMDCLAKNEADGPMPQHLRKTYGNFGYRYTLSRTFDEVVAMLIKQKWVKKSKNKKFLLTPAGTNELKSRMEADPAASYPVAAYGDIAAGDLLDRFANG